MKLIRPYFVVEGHIVGFDIIKKIEQAGRTAYKTEEKITQSSAEQFVKNLIKHEHESVIEHESVTVRIICDRGVTHEIVRHRLASYTQESTRYCNYGGGVTFIIPPWLKREEIEPGEYNRSLRGWKVPYDADQTWFCSMLDHEGQYIRLLEEGWTPQQARSVLPNSLKTEIVMTANLREWRHFFNLRTSNAAHPQMYEIARPLLNKFKQKIPVIFDDITY